MLDFGSVPAGNTSSDVYQIVDLTAYATEIDAGLVTVDTSAYFNATTAARVGMALLRWPVAPTTFGGFQFLESGFDFTTDSDRSTWQEFGYSGGEPVGGHAISRIWLEFTDWCPSDLRRRRPARAAHQRWAAVQCARAWHSVSGSCFGDRLDGVASSQEGPVVAGLASRSRGDRISGAPFLLYRVRRVQPSRRRQGSTESGVPWHDGTTHLVMSPLEFMQRLRRLCHCHDCT